MKAREFSWTALQEICIRQVYSNLYLRKHLQKVEEADRALATQIIYGTLQNAAFCRYQWSDLVKKQPEEPCALLLDMSVYQLLFMDKLPSYAIVHDAVEIAKKRLHPKIGSMINAVLRRVIQRGKKEVQAEGLERLALETSHPKWLVSMWKAQYGEERAKRICLSDMETKPLSVRVNTLKTSRERLLQEEGFVEGRLAEDALIYQGASLADSAWYKEGLISIQDEASQLVVELLQPQKGERILDVCAAPGTKSTHIAQKMENEGEIVCGDLHEHRVRLIEEGAKRLGISIIRALVMDATVLEQAQGEFDRVLCDVPCSGYGVLSRKSDIKYHMQSSDMDTLIPLQQAILSCACQRVKQGGVLLYSTCTLNKKENEKQVERFLKEHPQFVLEMQRTIFPYEYNSDGFYMARLKRKE